MYIILLSTTLICCLIFKAKSLTLVFRDALKHALNRF